MKEKTAYRKNIDKNVDVAEYNEIEESTPKELIYSLIGYSVTDSTGEFIRNNLHKKFVEKIVTSSDTLTSATERLTVATWAVAVVGFLMALPPLYDFVLRFLHK